MNRLIILRGPICAGKSTTSAALRKKIGACSVIDQDSFKRAIDDTTRSDWRRNVAFAASLHLAELLMHEKRDIIAEVHAGNVEQHDAFTALARSHGYNVFSFLLYPSLDVCQERNITRGVPEMQYALSAEDIKQYWINSYSIPNEPVIDTATNAPEHIATEILAHITTLGLEKINHPSTSSLQRRLPAKPAGGASRKTKN